MVFLKGILLLLVNILTGYLFAYAILAFLFLPRRRKYFGHKPIPFTPGFIYRKKQWVFDKLYGWYDDFIRQSLDPDNTASFLHRWEDDAFHKAWDELESLERIPLLPKGMKNGLRRTLANLVMEIVRKFLRELVPYLLDHYRIRNRVELLELKLDVDVLYDFFRRKIYRYLLWVFCGFAALIGIYNMIWFWILH